MYHSNFVGSVSPSTWDLALSFVFEFSIGASSDELGKERTSAMSCEGGDRRMYMFYIILTEEGFLIHITVYFLQQTSP